ncbi:CidA/LrgA family protein [Alteromonas oceanisediminis]|uniref:CidA/LrgA family protein n=1 Tax=Alteromonas oceanisediminis TaxID=2836180 RepID=UPI001BDAE3BE|nr:CidA/LrgA family protein [Alteromonas oceanisediminis]MBT0585104.1 CidA/LrgA family protein [Alteromonas oceanisediminis]
MNEFLRNLVRGVAGMASLFGYYFGGVWLAEKLPLPLPGALCGLLLLFLTCAICGNVPRFIEYAAKPLLSYLAVFFIPAVLGAWHFRALIVQQWPALLLSVVGSTVVALAITAVVAQRCQPKRNASEAHHEQR